MIAETASMRVRDSTTSGAPPAAAQVKEGGRRVERRRIRSSPGFGPVLTGMAASREVELDRPAVRASSRAPPPRPPGTIGVVDRVLVGARADQTEARVRVADGSPGGSEIRLIAAGGGRKIVAEILTASAGSRETLSKAMEEIRIRLRRRGIELSIEGGGQRGERDGQRAGRSDRDRRW